MARNSGGVLVIGAHPDDYELGAGATIAKWAAEGRAVVGIIVARGGSGREPGTADALERQAGASAGALSMVAVVHLGHEDQHLDCVPLSALSNEIAEHVRRLKPDVVLTHHPGDLNLDHAIVARAVLTACRPLPGSTVRRVLAFEVPGSTELATERQFRPTLFVQVSEGELHLKLHALSLYTSEARPSPYPRSPEALQALAAARGASAGLGWTEAFEVLREIEP